MAINACGGVLYQLDYSNSIGASASKLHCPPYGSAAAYVSCLFGLHEIFSVLRRQTPLRPRGIIQSRIQ